MLHFHKIMYNIEFRRKTLSASIISIVCMKTKKLCARLTDQHVFADKMKKMKVSIAAQVLSQRVAVLNFATECGYRLYTALLCAI